MAPIDCGLICSCLARSLDVAGPPRSSRDSAEVSAMVSSPGRCLAQLPHEQANGYPQGRCHFIVIRNGLRLSP